MKQSFGSENRCKNYGRIGYPMAGHIANTDRGTEQRKNDRYLSVSGAVFFNRPTGLVAESFQDLVVVAVLRQFIVTVHTQTGVDLRGDRSPSPLSPLVVLPLLPCWEPRSCHASQPIHRPKKIEPVRRRSIRKTLFTSPGIKNSLG